MALSNGEVTALRPIVAREGLDVFIDEIRAAAIADKKAAAVTALGNSVAVTVSSWTIPAAFVGQASALTLPSVIADINTAWAARDQAALGPLFVQLYAAAKAHLGL